MLCISTASMHSHRRDHTCCIVDPSNFVCEYSSERKSMAHLGVATRAQSTTCAVATMPQSAPVHLAGPWCSCNTACVSCVYFSTTVQVQAVLVGLGAGDPLVQTSQSRCEWPWLAVLSPCRPADQLWSMWSDRLSWVSQRLLKY
jgi:hypothetical protein